MSIWRSSPFLGLHTAHHLPKFGYEPTPAKYLKYIVLWDDSVVPSARAQSKCQLMDSAVKKLDICTKRTNEFTSRRIKLSMRLRLDPQAIRKYNQKQTSGRSSVVEQTLPKLRMWVPFASSAADTKQVTRRRAFSSIFRCSLRF